MKIRTIKVQVIPNNSPQSFTPLRLPNLDITRNKDSRKVSPFITRRVSHKVNLCITRRGNHNQCMVSHSPSITRRVSHKDNLCTTRKVNHNRPMPRIN